MKKLTFLLPFLFTYFLAFSQETEEKAKIETETPKFKPLIYFDTYYSYDFSEPANHEKNFVNQYSRHNEFNINMAVIKFSYANDNMRSNVGLHTGTFVNKNYVEPVEIAKLIHAANVGFKIFNKIWIDAGVMGCHFGYESILTFNNEMLTQSMTSEYTPYYQTGIKISSDVNDKFSYSFVVLNGWQQIYENNDTKAFGLGLKYKFSDNFYMSYGNFYGDVSKPEILKVIRIHNNFVTHFEKSKFKSTLILDHTFHPDVTIIPSGGFPNVKMVTFINSYQMTEKVGVALRYEYFEDKSRIFVNPEFFSLVTNILSGAVNTNVNKYIKCRAEAKYYFGNEYNWLKGSELSKTNWVINLGIAYKFE